MHTQEEIERAAKLAEEFDPSGVPMDNTTDLRAIAEAVASLRTRGPRARAGGACTGQRPVRGEIGIALGVSRQAARERFGEKVRA